MGNTYCKKCGVNYTYYNYNNNHASRRNCRIHKLKKNKFSGKLSCKDCNFSHCLCYHKFESIEDKFTNFICKFI